MSATPLLADVEDASSAWEFAPPAIAESEPWEVNMELPGGGPPIWKSFHSTPELFDLKLLIRDSIRDADTSMWDIFVDGDRLTNENTINMLKGKSAARTDGQARRVVVTAQRVQPAKLEALTEAQRVQPTKRPLRWPTWIVLSLSLLMFCSLAFALWYEREAYEEGLDEAYERGLKEGKIASGAGTINTTTKENITHKGSQKAYDEGSPARVSDDRPYVDDGPWSIEVAAAVGSLLICICIVLFFTALSVGALCQEKAFGLFVASVAALVALGVMSCAMISDLFLQAKQHSFSISLAACLTCMCQHWFLSLKFTRDDENLEMIMGIVAGVGMLFSEAEWIRCAEDVQDGQQLITIASASLLAVAAWLPSYIVTMAPVQAHKRCVAAVVGLVLQTLFAGYFVAMFYPSRFTLEKESKPRHSMVMMVLCVPLSSGSVAMALLNRSALLKARKHTREEDQALLVRSLFFAPMCIFTMLRLQEAWQWFAMTILTLAALFLTYVMRDWLKERWD